MAMRRRRSAGFVLGRVVIYFFLILLAVSFLYPVFFMLANSLKTQTEYMVDPFAVNLVNGHWENYGTMIRNFNILKYFRNTLVTDAASLVIGLVLAIIASYAFAKLRFVGRDKAYLGVMIVMFIPAQVTIIPMYVMFANIGLINTLSGIVLLRVANLAGIILLLTSNFRGVPNEMIEAAKMDGCGYLRTIWRIAVPMALPAIAICIILNFIGYWNDLLTPMVMIKSMEKQLIMPALNNLVGRYAKDIPFQMTGLLLASLPAILIYLILQKQIIMGVSMGSIK